MKERASFTAAWVAGCRSLGAVLPEHARLADDPYGARFAPPPMSSLLYTPRLARVALRRFIVYMQVRTRVLDDVLLDFARGGGRQIVLLGAGFDCRALRFAEPLSQATVFEIDHPATQAKKREVLRDDVGARTEYVAWDFEHRDMRDLPAALAGHGHDEKRPTLTIWEGVTMYLTKEAIDASVRAVAEYSAPRSPLALTYFDRTSVSRPSVRQRVVRRVVASVGEPFRFGWSPRELPGWFRARGFEVIRDDDVVDIAKGLLPQRFALPADRVSRHIAVVRKI